MTRCNVSSRYFGELALICEEESSSPVHVLAETNVDLYVLHRSAFDAIKRVFPELLEGTLIETKAHGEQRADVMSSEP